MKGRFLLTLLFLTGCGIKAPMEQRNPIGTFTTNLTPQELVDCMNRYHGGLFWLSPTKYTGGLDVIYSSPPVEMSLILDNGIAEMYFSGRFDSARFKKQREDYAAVCG